MTKDEALRMALEALDALCINDYSGYELGKRDAHLVDNALTAIKEALAQPEPEPVAFKIYKPTPPRGAIPNVRDAELPWVYDQDPSSGNVASMWVTPVKATPSQREWVGLTYEDMIEVWNKLYKERTDVMPLPTTFAKAIEAKLKQKNGYAEEKNT